MRNSIGELGMRWKHKFSMNSYLISRPVAIDNAKILPAMICNPNIQAQRNDIYKQFYGHKSYWLGHACLCMLYYVMPCYSEREEN